MALEIAATLFAAIDSSLESTLMSGTSIVMTGLGAAFGSVWLIHFTLKSMYWLFNGMDSIVQDIVFTVIKMAFIVYFAFNVGWYLNTIVPFVTGLPTWMGGVLSGQAGTQTNQIDVLINAFVNAVKTLIDAMDFDFWDDFNVVLLGLAVVLFMLIGGIPFILVCVGTLITLKASTTLMLVVGPIFIAFALFDQTRQWFMGWVSVVGGFMLTNVLFSVVIALEISFINSNVIRNGVIDTTWANAVSILLYFSAFTLLATELPNYAASVMGGVSSGGVGGVGGLVSKTAGIGAAKNMTSAAWRLMSKKRNTIK